VRRLPDGRAGAATACRHLAAGKDALLEKPIGITTAEDVFTPLVDAGRKLPYMKSETFTNKDG